MNCGALCETDCVGLNLGRNKDNNYSRDKRGAFGSTGPLLPFVLQWPKVGLLVSTVF